jgi:TetR/AcrR family transcriptional regulator, regulator of cefoperazone and chloramphenicol sensitivity
MEHAGPRRRPAAGGYARGDAKRMKIVEAALRVFGENGYERASTRQIAMEAGVNPPALQYYFDGKEGLHLACGKYIVEHISKAMEAAHAAADCIKPDDPEGAAAAADALCRIIDVLADFLLGSEQGEDWSRFIARSQTEGSGPGYSAYRQSLSAEILEVCVRLVAIATGRAAEDVLTKLRAIAILGQISTFHLGRDNALALLGWPNFYGERLKILKGIVRLQTQAILEQGALDEADLPALPSISS